MTPLLRALHAESLKLKRTLAFRMVLVAPLLVATLQFFVLLNRKTVAPGFNVWNELSKPALEVWAIFMLPLFITLETALLNGLEHGEKQWKHLLALPVPRYAVYLAKLLTAQTLVLGATVAIWILILLGGAALARLRPAMAFAGATPVLSILKSALLVWVASWLIIAIHTYVSIRWQGFALALGVGIGATFFALFAAPAGIGVIYPWLCPMNLFIPGREAAALALGGAGGLAASAAVCLDLARREITS